VSRVVGRIEFLHLQLTIGCPSILATTYYPLLKISSLHLVEPSLLIGEVLQNFNLRLSEMVHQRRDIWPSSEEAFQALRVRPRSSTWDERILKIYVVSFASLSSRLYITGLVLNRSTVFDRYLLQNTLT
jgi:hypothetical protein